MGLFDRKSAKVQGTSAPELSPTLFAADLTAASQIMDRWEAAMGNSDAMWDCIEAFARCGGFRGMEATLHDSYASGNAEDVVRRPWRWWAEAARLADAQGEHALAGRIFMFAVHFTNLILPRMNGVTQADVGLSYPSGGTYEDIARSAANSLGYLPPDMLILRSATDQIDVASALKLANSVAAS